MTYLKEAFECTVKELDRELIARGALMPPEERFNFEDIVGTPERNSIMAEVKQFYEQKARTIKPDASLSHISTEELIKVLLFKTGRLEIGGVRGTWSNDDRADLYDIEAERIIQNSFCVAAICDSDCLIEAGDGYIELRVRNYGRTYKLCGSEPFHYQPVAAGRMVNGFLVEEDVIATAAHCVPENPHDLRIIFGYRMADPHTPVTRFPNKDVYKAEEVVHKYLKRSPRDADWALIKLDRKVPDRSVVQFSTREISMGESIYVIGHPLGLPLKFAPATSIREVGGNHFTANLDIYSGNSGSPVFDADTHEIIGMVVRGKKTDFRWTGKCFASIVYPKTGEDSETAVCTKFSEFSRYLS